MPLRLEYRGLGVKPGPEDSLDDTPIEEMQQSQLPLSDDLGLTAKNTGYAENAESISSDTDSDFGNAKDSNQGEADQWSSIKTTPVAKRRRTDHTEPETVCKLEPSLGSQDVPNC